MVHPWFVCVFVNAMHMWPMTYLHRCVSGSAPFQLWRLVDVCFHFKNVLWVEHARRCLDVLQWARAWSNTQHLEANTLEVNILSNFIICTCILAWIYLPSTTNVYFIFLYIQAHYVIGYFIYLYLYIYIKYIYIALLFQRNIRVNSHRGKLGAPLLQQYIF